MLLFHGCIKIRNIYDDNMGCKRNRTIYALGASFTYFFANHK